MSPPLVGVLVGGASRRMGGRPKGLLPAPVTGEPLLARLVRLARELGLEVLVVGDAAPYARLRLGTASLADDPAGVGPLGGLKALLLHAGDRPAIALSCDLPRFTSDVLGRLAHSPSTADVLATRRVAKGLWEPLVARYRPARVLPAIEAQLGTGRHALQDMLARVEVEELPLSDEERATLIDWDEPADLQDR